MEPIKEPDWSMMGVVGAAGGAQGDREDAIGTHHLLTGVTAAKGAAKKALVDAGATKLVLIVVLRDRHERGQEWSAADDVEGSVAAKEVLGEDGGRVRFTGAAARALKAAMELAVREDAKKFSAVHLLRALLEEGNRARELLDACGISPQTVLASLDGGTERQEDGLPPLLHATRDALLARRAYRHMPLWKRWLTKHGGINWAASPAFWVRTETYDQASRRGDKAVGTEHVLLAVLATYEVALRYPHLAREKAPDPDTRFAGGERLARLGIDHASVHRALSGDRVKLTADARKAGQYLEEAGGASAEKPAGSGSGSCGVPSAEPGTGPLVELLLGEDTRARQLVDALAATPGD